VAYRIAAPVTAKDDHTTMKEHGRCYKLAVAFIWLYAMCCLNAFVFASEITLQDPVVADEWITIPITIIAEPHEQPASLQFDLSFDDTSFALLDVQVGDAAVLASKSVVFSESSPGTITVIVAGLNQNTITDGVVANISLCPLNEVADATSLGFDTVVVSDPFGKSVDVVYESPPEVNEEGTETESVSASEQTMPTEQEETFHSEPGETITVGGASGTGTTTENAETRDASALSSSTGNLTPTRLPLAILGSQADRSAAGDGKGLDGKSQVAGFQAYSGHANQAGWNNLTGYPSAAAPQRDLTDDLQEHSQPYLHDAAADGSRSLKDAYSNGRAARGRQQMGPIISWYRSGIGPNARRALTGSVIAFTVAVLALAVRWIVLR